MKNSTKPSNWRTYYWYRPPSWSVPQFTPKQIDNQAYHYVMWLAHVRGWEVPAAQAYCDAMSHRTTISQETAALLRDLAGNYGPRRAHKLRAMADFLIATPNANRRNTA